MYLARTSVRTALVLKWRQNKHERCLIEFVYFTLFVQVTPTHTSDSYRFGCENQMQINDGKTE